MKPKSKKHAFVWTKNPHGVQTWTTTNRFGLVGYVDYVTPTFWSAGSECLDRYRDREDGRRGESFLTLRAAKERVEDWLTQADDRMGELIARRAASLSS